MAAAMIDRRNTLRPDRRVLAVVAVLLVVSLAWVVPRLLRAGSAAEDTPPATTAAAAPATAGSTGTPAPLGQSQAPARLSPPLAPGAVALAAGAFGQGRSRFERLAVRQGPVPAVTGAVTYLGEYAGGPGQVEIGLAADFYDAAGNRVGAGTAIVRSPTGVALAERGGRRPALAFEVPAKGPAAGAVAARLAVTTALVEED
jgi:hypothetical protein